MRPDYPQWLAERKYADNTQTAQLHRVKKIEEAYGNLDAHFTQGTFQSVIDSLEYSTQDERLNKPNPSKLPIGGNIRKGLQSYRDAAKRYLIFLTEPGFEARPRTAVHAEPPPALDDAPEYAQRFSLERDMQASLRQHIHALDPALRIIDDGAERSVASGFIDITCEDDSHTVVIELKAGKADSRAIAQILGYMGDVKEEDGRPVRGILVAHDFDTRTLSAARVVPSLTLKKYAITFTFMEGQ